MGLNCNFANSATSGDFRTSNHGKALFKRECKSSQVEANFSFKMPFKQKISAQIVASVLIKLKVVENRGNFA